MCGEVTFSFHVDALDYGFCHCRTCQKASGVAFTANLPVGRKDIELAGADSIREYESSAGKFRCFCANCGSPLFAYRSKSPDILRVRLGSLDTTFDESPRCHFFTADKAPWFAGSHMVQEFPAWPDRSVMVVKGSNHTDDLNS